VSVTEPSDAVHAETAKQTEGRRLALLRNSLPSVTSLVDWLVWFGRYVRASPHSSVFILAALGNLLVAYHDDRRKRFFGFKSLLVRCEQKKISGPFGTQTPVTWLSLYLKCNITI
jgi:hypothetical protein